MGIRDAMLQMVLQDHFGCAAQCGADRGQLNQHFGAVPSVLYHALDRFQVADGPGKAVQHCFGLGMDMTVIVTVFLTVLHRVAVDMAIPVIVIEYFFFFVFVHGFHSFLRYSKLYTLFPAFASPPGGSKGIHKGQNDGAPGQ